MQDSLLSALRFNSSQKRHGVQFRNPIPRRIATNGLMDWQASDDYCFCGLPTYYWLVATVGGFKPEVQHPGLRHDCVLGHLEQVAQSGKHLAAKETFGSTVLHISDGTVVVQPHQPLDGWPESLG